MRIIFFCSSTKKSTLAKPEQPSNLNALTVAGISFVCYIIAGFVQNALVVLPIGIVLTLGTLFVLRMVFGKKAAKP